MSVISIDGIAFEFDPSWSVEKWDESRWYRDGICRLNGQLDGNREGSKAVDVIGVRGEVPYLFEVKDFRGVAIENKQRQLRDLPLEVGLKARDTVAGLLGWVALGKSDALPLRWIRSVRDDNRRIQVVALLAEDAARPGEPVYKRQVRESERTLRLKQKLAWLTPRVRITDPLRDAEELSQLGVTARSEADAGPGRSR